MQFLSCSIYCFIKFYNHILTFYFWLHKCTILNIFAAEVNNEIFDLRNVASVGLKVPENDFNCNLKFVDESGKCFCHLFVILQLNYKPAIILPPVKKKIQVKGCIKSSAKTCKLLPSGIAHQIAPKIEHSIMTDPDEKRSASVELHKHMAMQLTQHGDLTVWS